MKPSLHGMVGEFTNPEEVLAAAQQARAAGFTELEAYTPFPVEGLAEEVGLKKTRVPLLALLGGIVGGTSGYFMMWYTATIDYPLNVGGRPLHSWPSFIPITFEMTILCAALATVIGMLALNGLPKLYHPIFNTPHFEERNGSRGYLCVKGSRAETEKDRITAMLRQAGAAEVWEVPS